MDVTIAISTFGMDRWRELAEQRAALSARDQAPVVLAHAATLHEARNSALAQVETDWVIFLDADDELEPGYVDALATGTADIRAPAVRYVLPSGRAEQPRVPRVVGPHHRFHDCDATCLRDGNFIVVGAAVRAQLVRDVGGWEPWPVYEDWALWLRCAEAGATVESIPGAVYRAHVRRDSRNRAPSMAAKNRVHHEIVTAVLGTEAAA